MRREIFENWHQPVLLSEQVGISSDGVSVHWEERSREGKVWKGMEGAEMGGGRFASLVLGVDAAG